MNSSPALSGTAFLSNGTAVPNLTVSFYANGAGGGSVANQNANSGGTGGGHVCSAGANGTKPEMMEFTLNKAVCLAIEGLGKK